KTRPPDARRPQCRLSRRTRRADALGRRPAGLHPHERLPQEKQHGAGERKGPDGQGRRPRPGPPLVGASSPPPTEKPLATSSAVSHHSIKGIKRNTQSQFPIADFQLSIPSIGNWKLAIGNWKLEIGNWKSEITGRTSSVRRPASKLAKCSR